MTRGGKPVTGHPFRLTTEYVDSSGGHDHFADRRNVNFTRENYGHFILTRTNGHIDRPYQGETQLNGIEEFHYAASIWGDSMRIKIESTQLPKLLNDSVTIAERVPDLELLPERDSYVRVGGTDEHRGPPDFIEDRNHYGTATLIEDVTAIADSFAVEYENHRLRINDMSLPFGGAFDINGNWEQDVIEPNCRQPGFGHCGHRRGQNADISFQLINPRGQQVVMTGRQRLLLLQIITLIAGAPYQHSSHLHVQ